MNGESPEWFKLHTQNATQKMGGSHDLQFQILRHRLFYEYTHLASNWQRIRDAV